MAITDLTNTTWNIPAGWTCSAGYGTFSLHGNINDDYFQGGVEFGKGNWNGDGFPNASNSIAYWATDGAVAYFSSSTPLTITITGGTDVSNTKLISWLEANGTQVIDITPKEQFINQLNELSDAINEKAKTSGKMTISQMIETLGNESVIIPESKPKEQFYFLFNSLSDTINEKAGTSGKLTISQMIENVKSIVIEEETNYLTFSSPSTFTLNIVDNIQYWDGTLEYSTDTTTWNTWDGTTTLNSSADGKLYMRGTGNTKITNTNSSDKGCWILTGNNISCKGNIENLLDYKTVENGQHPTMDRECYSYMFYGCTSLIEAPELSAVDLTINCYSHMFYGCSSLVEPSKLYPNIIAGGCFYGMYFGCSNIKGMIDLTKITDFTSSSIIADFSSNYFPIIRLGTNLKTITNNIFTLTLEVPNISLRFEFTDSDTPQFDTTNYLAKGTNKSTRSYKIYTDNTTIKDGALSQADSATTVNVYHLDGSDWGTA